MVDDDNFRNRFDTEPWMLTYKKQQRDGAFRDRAAPDFLPPAKNPSMRGFETLDAGNPSGYGEISSVDRNPQTGEVTASATNTGGIKYPFHAIISKSGIGACAVFGEPGIISRSAPGQRQTVVVTVPLAT